jgi:hypothetical protein
VRAWWAYWLTLAVGAALWIGVAVATPGGTMRDALHHPVWLFVLLAPLVAAGGNLIVFRRQHETICRLEAERHAWLRMLVGRGYSATTFAATGVALVGLAGMVLYGVVSGAW